MAGRTFTFVRAGADQEHAVELRSNGGAQEARVGDAVYTTAAERDGSLRIGGARAWAVAAGDVRWVFVEGEVYELVEAHSRTRARGTSHGSLAAPMPATVRRVLVRPGDSVKRGDSLLILEAMKMELPIRAGTAGVVSKVLCREGELVQPGVALIEIDE